MKKLLLIFAFLLPSIMFAQTLDSVTVDSYANEGRVIWNANDFKLRDTLNVVKTRSARKDSNNTYTGSQYFNGGFISTGLGVLGQTLQYGHAFFSNQVNINWGNDPLFAPTAGFAVSRAGTVADDIAMFYGNGNSNVFEIGQQLVASYVPIWGTTIQANTYYINGVPLSLWHLSGLDLTGSANTVIRKIDATHYGLMTLPTDDTEPGYFPLYKADASGYTSSTLQQIGNGQLYNNTVLSGSGTTEYGLTFNTTINKTSGTTYGIVINATHTSAPGTNYGFAHTVGGAIKFATYADGTVQMATDTALGKNRKISVFRINIRDTTSLVKVWIAEFPQDIVLDTVGVMLAGSGSITPEFRFDPDYSATGTLIATPTAATSTTTGDRITSFTNRVIPAGSQFWLKLMNRSGTQTEIIVWGTGHYRY
jgi:hypothetical protein